MIMHVLAALVLAPAGGSHKGTRTKVLFTDREQLAGTSPAVQIRMHPPVKLGQIIFPEHPWEGFALGGYSALLEFKGEMLLLYTCMAGFFAKDSTCLATSRDGRVWTKPMLRVHLTPDGQPTNIVFPPTALQHSFWEFGGAFVDSSDPALPIKLTGTWGASDGSNPDYPAGKREVSGQHVFASADAVSGFVQVGPTGSPLSAFDPNAAASYGTSDTANNCVRDTANSRYLCFVRYDIHTNDTMTCPGYAPGAPSRKYWRRVGRCATTNLGKWCTNSTGGTCALEMSDDENDEGWEAGASCQLMLPHNLTDRDLDPCADLYSAPTVLYESVYVHFVSIFFHRALEFGADGTTPLGTDGHNDVRLLTSRDGLSADYVPSLNGHEPFVELGVSQCSEVNEIGACGAATLGGPGVPFDAGNIYMSQGVVRHPDGEHLLMSYAAYPFGDYGITRAPANGSDWRQNNGVGLLRSRVDGFASIEAPHSSSSTQPLHSFTTVLLRVPTAALAGGLTVEVNFAAGVAGIVQVELRDEDGRPIPSYTKADAEPLFGNFVRRKARWGRPLHWQPIAHVPSHCRMVQLAVFFKDARVYSLTLDSAGDVDRR